MTRTASGKALRSCCGPNKRETGLKQSLTEMSSVCGDSSCWRTGATLRRANVSQGHRNAVHGTSSSPSYHVVAPGPIEEVHANARRRLLIFEKATAL